MDVSIVIQLITIASIVMGIGITIGVLKQSTANIKERFAEIHKDFDKLQDKLIDHETRISRLEK